MEEEEKKKNCFLMFYDWEPLLNMLTEEEVGGLLFALYAYEIREEVPREGALSPSATSLFVYLSKLLDDSKKSWYDKRKAGSKGGKKSADLKQTSSNIQAEVKQTSSRPQADLKQTSSNTQAEVKQNQPKEKEKEKEKEKVSPNGDIERDKRETGKPSRVFVPPTLEEVEEEIRIKGYNVDALEFFNYYDSQGWKKANGQKVTSWKGCLVTWIKKDESRSKAGSLSTPTQPETEPFNDWLQRRLREEEEKKNGNVNIPQVVGYIPTGLPEAGQ